VFTLVVQFYSITAHAGCDAEAVSSAVQSAEEAFVGGDPKSMGVALAGVRRALGCIREPVSPGLCAEVHRAHALGAWLNADQPGAVGSLRAMLHANPRQDLGLEVVPREHALNGLLLLAEESPLSWTRAPASGWVLVDGVRTGAVPVGQPYVLQTIKGDGKAGGARLVRSATEGSSGSSLGSSGGGNPRRVLRWTGVGLGVVSAALYGGAWASNRSYYRAVAAEDNARIGATHMTTNLLSVGSVAGASLGVGAVISSTLF
jgi:hypothetical protein